LPSVVTFDESRDRAVQHFAADLHSYVSVAVIIETHFKSKHTDSIVGIEGYRVRRRDRARRRGGGVALYVQSTIQSSVWTPLSADSRTFELLWVHVGGHLVVAALYHPPRPVHPAADLLSHIEISHDYPLADIVIAGDLDQLSDNDMVERTGLTQLVHQPTRGVDLLDRIFVSDPRLYDMVRVVSSVVQSV